MVISKRLGHANVNITWEVYAHLYPEREAIEMNSVIERYKSTYLQ